MQDGMFLEQITDLRSHVQHSHKLLRSAPIPYHEVLSDAFQQLDTSLEGLQVAEEALRRQHEALTESRQTLERERHRYQALFEFAPDGYLITDADGIIREANRAAGILFNISPRFLVGKPLPAFVHGPDRAALRRELIQIQHSGHLPECEVSVKPRRSVSFPAAITVTADCGADGAITSLRWMVRDASERQRARRRLLTMNEELERRVAERTQALHEALGRERRVAETLQRSLLGQTPEGGFPGLSLHTIYEPASHDLLVGGDFFDVYPTASQSCALVVGDVSGKGLTAATFTAEAKYALRAILRETEAPAEALGRLNEYLCSSYQRSAVGDVFIALSLAVVAPQTGEIRAAQAGAEPLAVQRASGIEWVKPFGLPLGILSGGRYEEACLTLDRGDRLLMMTDGITEARCQGEFITQQQLMALIARSRRAASVRQAGDFLIDAVREYACGHLHDDACLLIAERQEEDP